MAIDVKHGSCTRCGGKGTVKVKSREGIVDRRCPGCGGSGSGGLRTKS